MKDEKSRFVLDHLVNNNDPQYNLLKAAEELQELSLILTQRVNKGDLIPDSKIIEEIGDIKIRLKVLERIFPKQSIAERVAYKINKFYKYIKEQKYKNI